MSKLKDWILPKEIDFFKLMSDQCIGTYRIIRELTVYYCSEHSGNPEYIFDLIVAANKNRSTNIRNLNATFITPVDKEAISRIFTQLYWVALSVKHLIVEINAYKIYDLKMYKNIFDLLFQEMSELSDGFNKLSKKEYDDTLKLIDHIIHLDNKLIKNYGIHLAQLFTEQNLQHILMHKEILSQLKEISKRIHICTNQLEDIVFKLN